MTKKTNIGVVFGGKSGEYDVSLLSAYNVLKGIDKDKYDVTLVGISLEGKFFIYEGPIERIPDNTWIEDTENLVDIISIFNEDRIDDVDIIFPVLHGQNCEDGRIQGLFEYLDKPYVGCEVMSSAVCMDKDIAKKIFRSANIPVVEDVVVFNSETEDDEELEKVMDRCEETLDYPMFIKPVNMGSSVGINKAHDRESLKYALRYAAKFDIKILVERAVNAREIECAVLGNDHPEAAMPGEIVSCREFYDYEAKYLSGDDSVIEIPANIDADTLEKIRRYAVKGFRAAGCMGLARVDFFVEKETGNIYLNEINTLPGFTNISMYPKMWEHMGLGYSELIDRLVELGFERYETKHRLTIKE